MEWSGQRLELKQRAQSRRTNSGNADTNDTRLTRWRSLVRPSWDGEVTRDATRDTIESGSGLERSPTGARIGGCAGKSWEQTMIQMYIQRTLGNICRVEAFEGRKDSFRFV